MLVTDAGAEIAGRDILRIDHLNLAVLYLINRRDVRIRHARRTEGDRAEEGLEAALAQLLANGVAILAAGALDGELQDDADTGTGGLGEVGLAAVFRLEQLNELGGRTEHILAGVAQNGVE